MNNLLLFLVLEGCGKMAHKIVRASILYVQVIKYVEQFDSRKRGFAIYFVKW